VLQSCAVRYKVNKFQCSSSVSRHSYLARTVHTVWLHICANTLLTVVPRLTVVSVHSSLLPVVHKLCIKTSASTFEIGMAAVKKTMI